MNQACSFFPFAILLAIGIGNARSEDAKLLELADPFTDNAILQRESDVPVWGWAKPRTRITVSFAAQDPNKTNPRSRSRRTTRHRRPKNSPITFRQTPRRFPLQLSETLPSVVVLNNLIGVFNNRLRYRDVVIPMFCG